MGHRTPLYEAHLAAGGTMVDFAGWDMPVHYGSQLAEHHAVRTDAGMFDVSHMRAVDFGPGSQLRRFLANDIAGLQPGRALYTCMCNPAGGVLDDLIVYRIGDTYRVVVNCATTESDLAWLAAAGPLQARDDLAIIAVQGPAARAKVEHALGIRTADLRPFSAAYYGELFVGRTGYTGEDGLELMLPAQRAGQAWRALAAAGVQPAGLGARDTLRLEAGLNLYGNEMDAGVTPLECGLAWTVDFDHDFIGRDALLAQQPTTRFVGLVLRGRGVMRSQQTVRTADGEGLITSGTFSPTLGLSIAMARIPLGAATAAEVDVRGRWLPADIVRLPFVRNGERRYTPEGERS